MYVSGSPEDYIRQCIEAGSMAIFPSGEYIISGQERIDFTGNLTILAYGAIFKRPDNSIKTNFDRVLHFRSSGGTLRIFGLTVDGNAQNQNIPANPNDWQHCHNIWIESTGDMAINAHYYHCNMINRVGAGISHGSSTGTQTFGSISMYACTGVDPVNIRGDYEATRSYERFSAVWCNIHRLEAEIQSRQSSHQNETIVLNSIVDILDINTEGVNPVNIQNNIINEELRLTYSAGIVRNNDIKITNDYLDLRPLKVTFENNHWTIDNETGTGFRAAGSGACEVTFDGDTFTDNGGDGWVFFDLLFSDGEYLTVQNCDFQSEKFNVARIRAGAFTFEDNNFGYDGSNNYSANIVRTANGQQYSAVTLSGNDIEVGATEYLDQA